MLDVSAVNTLNRTVQLSNIIRAQYSSGRIALPVNSGMYTRLKHVEGVPARSAGQGFPVSKLEMIDLLVDRLVRLKNEPVATARPTDDAHADQLITDYARQVSRALRSSTAGGVQNNALRYTAGIAEPGAVLNLVA